MTDKKKEVDTLTIVRAIHQAAADSFDRQDPEGSRAGLKGDKGVHWKDPRIIDGFNVSISGTILKVSYHTPIHVSEIKGVQQRMDSTFDGILKYLKTQFKKETGKSLRLKDKGHAQTRTEMLNAKSGWATSTRLFDILNLK